MPVFYGPGSHLILFIITLVPQILQMLLLPVGMRSGELFMTLKGVTRTADTVRRQGGRAAKHIQPYVRCGEKQKKLKRAIIIAFIIVFDLLLGHDPPIEKHCISFTELFVRLYWEQLF